MKYLTKYWNNSWNSSILALSNHWMDKCRDEKTVERVVSGARQQPAHRGSTNNLPRRHDNVSRIIQIVRAKETPSKDDLVPKTKAFKTRQFIDLTTDDNTIICLPLGSQSQNHVSETVGLLGQLETQLYRYPRSTPSEQPAVTREYHRGLFYIQNDSAQQQSFGDTSTNFLSQNPIFQNAKEQIMNSKISKTPKPNFQNANEWIMNSKMTKTLRRNPEDAKERIRLFFGLENKSISTRLDTTNSCIR